MNTKDPTRIKELRAALDRAPHIPNRGEVEDALDRLHAIESAPSMVVPIAERFAARQRQIATLKAQNAFASARKIDNKLHQDIATMLDAVRGLGIETSQTRLSLAEARQSLDCSRAEVLRLGSDLLNAREALDRLKAELAAEKKRGDVLAEGVRLYRAAAESEFHDARKRHQEVVAGVDAWERERGGLCMAAYHSCEPADNDHEPRCSLSEQREVGRLCAISARASLAREDACKQSGK